MGIENPHDTLEQVRDSPKVTVFCTISWKEVYRPNFFDDNVTGDNYLHVLQSWLMDRDLLQMTMRALFSIKMVLLFTGSDLYELT